MKNSDQHRRIENVKAALGRCSGGLLLSLLFGAIIFTSLYPVGFRAQASNSLSNQTAQRHEPKNARHPKHVDSAHMLAASYYSLKDGLSASLMLSNQGPHSMDIRVVLFSLSGERLDLPAVTLEPTTVRSYDLGQWAGAGGPSFQEGSVQVLYNGMSMELGGAVKMINEKKSLILDEELSEPEMDFASSRLEGVWWLPSRRAELRLVLSNVTNSYMTATVTVDQNEAKTVNLVPHETRVINLSRGEREFGGLRLRQLGGISISYSGNKGALLARGLIAEANVGYSQVVEFKDPSVAKSSSLNGAGLRLGKINGKTLHPVAVARNTGTDATVVTGRIRYTTADGTQGTANLPEVDLAAGETKIIDVESAANSIGSLQNLTVGLEFDYTTAPGSVVVSAQSVSADDNQVYRVSVVDALAQMSSSGKYPWDLTKGATTVVYIKNVTDEEHSYYLQVSYKGGFWVQGIKTIAPHQTVALDLRQVKDQGIKDQDGNTLPADADGGQVYWVLMEPKNLTLIGRVEQVEAGGGLSFTTACGTCCLTNFNYPVMTPSSKTVAVGDTTTFTYQAAGQYSDCYGNFLASTTPAPHFGVTWSTDNPAVASISPSSGSSADVTAVGAGTANIYAEWTAPNQTYGEDCSDPDTGCGGFNGGGQMNCHSDPVSTTASASFKGIAKPNIDSLTPSRGLAGTTVTFTINGSGLKDETDETEATEVQIAGEGSDQPLTITAKSDDSTSRITVTLKIAANAPEGNHSVKVVVDGITSNAKDFYVQYPRKLIRKAFPDDYKAHVSEDSSNPGISVLKTLTDGPVVGFDGQTMQAGGNALTHKCGAYRLLLYQLADAEGQAIQPGSTTVTVNESFSDQTGNTSSNVFTGSTQTNEVGYVADLNALLTSAGSCPTQAYNWSGKQHFTVTVGSGTAITLSTIVQIGLSFSPPSTYTVSNSIVTP